MTIELISLNHCYDNFCIKDLSLKINAGELIRITGKNGSGKTTLLKIIGGLIKNDNVYIDSRKISHQDFSLISYMDSSPFFYELLKVNEKIDLLKSIYSNSYESRVDNWMEELELNKYRDELVKNLSLGNRQKLGLLTTLINKPQYILLDEPFNGIDSTSVIKIVEIFKCLIRERKTIIITTHIKSVIDDLCTRLITIDDGRILEDMIVQKA